MLDDVNQSVQHLGQGAARLPRMDHAAVQGREDVRMPGEYIAQAGTRLDIVQHRMHSRLEARVLRLLLKDLELVQDRNRGTRHGAELLGEEDQFARPDPGTTRFQLLPVTRQRSPAAPQPHGLRDVAAGGDLVSRHVRRVGFDDPGNRGPVLVQGMVGVGRHSTPLLHVKGGVILARPAAPRTRAFTQPMITVAASSNEVMPWHTFSATSCFRVRRCPASTAARVISCAECRDRIISRTWSSTMRIS